MRLFFVKVTQTDKEIVEENRSNDIVQAKKVLRIFKEQEGDEFVSLLDKVASRLDSTIILEIRTRRKYDR